jgi:hypothetical protein
MSQAQTAIDNIVCAFFYTTFLDSCAMLYAYSSPHDVVTAIFDRALFVLNTRPVSLANTPTLNKICTTFDRTANFHTMPLAQPSTNSVVTASFRITFPTGCP